MKTRTRNIIAISVAAVAALAIIFVIVLAVVRIEPLKVMLDTDNYSIRYGAQRLAGGEKTSEKIDSRKKGLQDGDKKSTTVDELINLNSFSVFKAWSQFKYDYSPRLADHDSDSHESIGKGEIKQVSDGTSSKLDGKFSLKFSFSEVKKFELKDAAGNDYTQTYDTAIVVLSDTAGWVGNITMYVFENAKLNGTLDASKIGSSDIGYTAFYPIQFGAVTTEAIDILYNVFDINPDGGDTETEDVSTNEEE